MGSEMEIKFSAQIESPYSILSSGLVCFMTDNVVKAPDACKHEAKVTRIIFSVCQCHASVNTYNFEKTRH